MLLRAMMAQGSGSPPSAYATWNPADCSADLTLSGGNLAILRNAGAAGWRSVRATLGKNAGKWYLEYKNTGNSTTDGRHMFGLMLAATSLSQNPGQVPLESGIQDASPNVGLYQNGYNSNYSGYGTPTVGDYLYVAVDFDAGKVWYKRSGATDWIGSGTPESGLNPTFTFTPGTTLYPAIGIYDNPGAAEANFGASAFNGTVPSGFNAGWYA